MAGASTWTPARDSHAARGQGFLESLLPWGLTGQAAGPAGRRVASWSPRPRLCCPRSELWAAPGGPRLIYLFVCFSIF